MTTFLQSLTPARIVFVMLAFTACTAFAVGKLEAKDFMTLAMLAFAFYFCTPNTSAQPTEIGGAVK